jgi:hypothetical protein
VIAGIAPPATTPAANARPAAARPTARRTLHVHEVVIRLGHDHPVHRMRLQASLTRLGVRDALPTRSAEIGFEEPSASRTFVDPRKLCTAHDVDSPAELRPRARNPPSAPNAAPPAPPASAPDPTPTTRRSPNSSGRSSARTPASAVRPPLIAPNRLDSTTRQNNCPACDNPSRTTPRHSKLSSQ